MNKPMEIIKHGGVQMWLACIAVVLSLACSIYYAIQSNIDSCFNIVFLILMLAGAVIAAADIVTGINALLPAASIAWSAATGVAVYDMMPALSDVWNNVVLAGGNLIAFIIYTVLALAVTVLSILACFTAKN
ncbi:MAG: hypothetical protein IJ138_00665 [Clostridia bacterium]|nr:hypothetical protein [Clostridia bacterium]